MLNFIIPPLEKQTICSFINYFSFQSVVLYDNVYLHEGYSIKK